MSTFAIYSQRIRRSLEGCRPKPSLRLCLFEEGFCLDLFGFLISLPFLDAWRHDPDEMMESWGVYLSDSWKWDSIVLCWGPRTKFWHMPWEYRHHSWMVLRPDGTWAKQVQSYDVGEPDGREVWTMPYHYCLRSWKVQEVTATFNVQRGEWRRKFTRWLPAFMGSWFAKVSTCIDVSFSEEVGERTGSWKGGTIGCAYELRKDETPPECLRRMERERKFN